MTEEEEMHLQTQVRDEDNDMQQIRRRMDDDAGSDTYVSDEEDTAPTAVIDTPDAIRQKLGKYKGFQGRAKSLWRGEIHGDHRWSESQYSFYKQRFLSSFIEQQSLPWQNSSSEPYVFMDMFGGLGMWADRFTGEFCAGSPLCIYDALERNGVDYRGLVFEQDPNRAHDLQEILYNRRDNITVYNRDNREAYEVFEERFIDSSQTDEPSLLYFDYTRQANSDHIKEIAQRFPRTDMLIHYSSTAFKRAINSSKCCRTKAHKGNAQYLTYLFNKRYWYINNWDDIPHNKFNFVSIYGTNVRSESILPEHGDTEDILYSYDSPRGQDLRRKAELTKKQINQQNS